MIGLHGSPLGSGGALKSFRSFRTVEQHFSEVMTLHQSCELARTEMSQHASDVFSLSHHQQTHVTASSKLAFTDHVSLLTCLLHVLYVWFKSLWVIRVAKCRNRSSSYSGSIWDSKEERGVVSLQSTSANTGGLGAFCPGTSNGRQALSQYLICTSLVLVGMAIFSTSPSRYCDLWQTLAVVQVS